MGTSHLGAGWTVFSSPSGRDGGAVFSTRSVTDSYGSSALIGVLDKLACALSKQKRVSVMYGGEENGSFWGYAFVNIFCIRALG